MTSGPPTASDDAMLPSASIKIADGVPLAPNASPVRNPWSSRIVESSPRRGDLSSMARLRPLPKVLPLLRSSRLEPGGLVPGDR